MVDLPAQLQRQIEEVEAFDAQLEAANAAPLDPPAEDAQSEPLAVAPIAPAPVVEPVVDTTDWKAKYLTLQGMFNADVPRLHAEVKDLKARNVTLAAELASRPVVAPPAPLAPVTDRDTETFGGDLVDLIHRKAAELVAASENKSAAEIKRLEAETASLKAAQGDTAAQTAAATRQKYWGELATLVPTYETVNVEPGFIGWLAEVDEMSGLTRQQMLKNAFDNFDAKRTALMFNTWIAKGTPPAAPVAPPAKTEAQMQLERQTSPAGSKAVTPSTRADDSTRIWTAAEVDQFYRAQGRGEFKGNPGEAVRIEANIDLALSEGRIA